MKVAQSDPTLSDPMDCCPLGSSVHGILQAMENTGMGSLLFTFPGDPPNPGIKPRSPTLQVDSSLSKPQEESLSLKFLSVPVLHLEDRDCGGLCPGGWGVPGPGQGLGSGVGCPAPSEGPFCSGH